MSFLTGYVLLYIPCGTKFLQEFIFADWKFFLFCGNNICDYDRLVFLAGNKFSRFQKVLDKSLIIFSFLLSTCSEIINNYIFSDKL